MNYVMLFSSLIIFIAMWGVIFYLMINSFKCMRKGYWEEMIAKLEECNENLKQLIK